MNTQELKIFCRNRPAATEHLLGPPSNILIYSVGKKNFAYFKTSDPEKWRFSIRVTPERFIDLTDVPGIKPARYMGRFRWITIVDVSQVPETYLLELVEWSHQMALDSLSKARRSALIPPQKKS